jgi:hypothetical protein
VRSRSFSERAAPQLVVVGRPAKQGFAHMKPGSLGCVSTGQARVWVADGTARVVRGPAPGGRGDGPGDQATAPGDQATVRAAHATAQVADAMAGVGDRRGFVSVQGRRRTLCSKRIEVINQVCRPPSQPKNFVHDTTATLAPAAPSLTAPR